VETIGFFSVFTEAMLGAPQFYRNHQKKSTMGMRFVELIIKMIIILSKPTFTQLAYTTSLNILRGSYLKFACFMQRSIY